MVLRDKSGINWYGLLILHGTLLSRDRLRLVRTSSLLVKRLIMKALFPLFFVCFFALASSRRIFYRGRGKHGNLGSPFTDKKFDGDELYFDQKLDHFNPSNIKTWKQRYFENDEFYKSGGPVFLMIGGEAEASPKWMVDGAWINYAKKFNAYCVLVEHRFYGKSHPTEDLSVKNLAYLSSEQALADLAWFITSFNNKKNFEEPPKWIVFGGSYPGSLAAWMRLKYPHLVHGAVSSSGPLLALTNFKDYFLVVRKSLEGYNPDCVTAIENGTKQLTSLLGHPLGQRNVAKLFNLCDPMELNNDLDTSNLYESLASNFAGVVQYNKDNRHTDSKMVNVTIDRVCDMMTDGSVGKEIERLAQVNSLILKENEEPCLDFKYEKMIIELRETGWNSTAATGSRQWTYQTCTEFGFFQSSDLNSTARMFSNRFPVDFFTRQCADVYGTKFNREFVEESTTATNAVYGGLDDRAVNVVYVHGSVDPWHALGITKTLIARAPAIFIAGTAHCANMYPPSTSDLPQLTAARQQIETIIGEWVSQ